MNELLKFRVRRHSACLCKTALEFVEDMIFENEIKIKRVKDLFAPELHQKIDEKLRIDSEKIERFRKRILDQGGDFNREISLELANYDLSLK